MEGQFPAHLQALLTVALTLDGEDATALFEFLPEADKKVILPRAEKYIALPEADRRNALSAGLKALRSEFLLRQITDVHPSHIGLVLAGEPAHIIRLIFHNLPTELANEIVKHLPERTARALATCPEPPQLSPELLDVIKHAFIRQFTFILPGENQLTRLNSQRLRALLREVSLQTISVAMRRIDRQELVDSLQRFPRVFAKEIVRRLKLLREIDIDQVLLAERCLVWLNGQQLRNFNITEDTGLMMLAGALVGEDKRVQKFLGQKFSIEESGRFFDLIARMRQSEPDLQEFARKQVLDALRALLQPRRVPEQSNISMPPA